MGGFDFFKLDLTNPDAKPERLPEPYNSLADDIFIDISNDEKHGFISSNRNGSVGDMDIFEIFFKAYKTTFEGLAVYKNDQTPANAEIIIIDKTTNKEVTRVTPDPKTGKYNVALENNKAYTFNVNGSEDNQAFTADITIPEQDKDVQTIQLIELQKLMNNDGQNNANEMLIKSDFETNNSGISLANFDIFDKSKASYSAVTDRIEIDVFNIADANFERFFGYNQNEVANLDRFNSFLSALEKAVKLKDSYVLTIDASASKVPTRTFKTNTKLAKKRATVARKAIEKYFKDKNIDISNKLEFNETSKVQGPNYKGDFDKNRSTYEQFQFVKIKVEQKK